MAMNAPDTYERALDLLLRFKPEVVDIAGTLTMKHPEFAMGHALMAYLCLIATDVPELPPARAAHAAMATGPLGDRESAHAAAIGAWLAGDWNRASAILDELLNAWPTDVLALQVGHQLDFFLGDRRNLRDRPARSLDAFDRGDARAAAVRGMYAFGLEETGHYEQAEEVGMSALEVLPDDVWAIHAVVHTLEMRGLVDRGIPFLRGRVGDWGDGNLFTVHNWWHLSLFELEAGRHAEVLDIYDRHLHNADAAGVPLEMLDASALLWRLALDGVDSGDRFAALADAWASRTMDEPWYVFNDVHAAMAFAGAGRLDVVKAVIAKLETDVGDDDTRTNARMTKAVGLPATKAVLAFAEDRHDDVVDTLAPIRRTLHHFGGSHAQRDVLQRTLLESALRCRRFEFAAELLSERLGERETSVYGWTRRHRLLSEIGDAAAAEDAAAHAAELQSRFAAA
jgi:tetratricopeptide (TPR) repeat protein